MVEAVTASNSKSKPQQQQQQPQPGQGRFEFENPYLDNEKKIRQILGEDIQDSLDTNQKIEEAHEIGGSVIEKQIFDSFVKEKTSLLNYVNDLVKYAAKCQSIELSEFMQDYKEGQQDEKLKITTEMQSNLVQSRVIGIVSFLTRTNFLHHHHHQFTFSLKNP